MNHVHHILLPLSAAVDCGKPAISKSGSGNMAKSVVRAGAAVESGRVHPGIKRGTAGQGSGNKARKPSDREPASSQTSGTYKLVISDLVLTATGAVGPFRYVVIYNDTATNDELIAWYDIGSAVTMANTDTVTLDFDGTNGFIQLT